MLPDRKERYERLARRAAEWILEHSWNGEYFYPILDRNGTVTLVDYMVRSDAWVFNAMAAASKYLGEGPWDEAIGPCFERMESADFSGPETHASKWWKRLAGRGIGYAQRALAVR